MAAPALQRGTEKINRPAPLVKLKKHPVKWAHNFIHSKAVYFIAVFVALPLGVAVYYLTTQTTALANDTWHYIAPDDGIRHYLRNVSQGFYASLFGLLIVWNRYKYSNKIDKELHWLDRLEMRLGIPNLKDDKHFSPRQIILVFFWSSIYAIPGFVLGLVITGLIHRNADALPVVAEVISSNRSSSASSEWIHVIRIMTTDWDEKLIGLGCAFVFGRRPARGFFDDVQGMLVKRRLKTGGHLHWYHTPGYQAHFNDMQQHPELADNYANLQLDIPGMLAKLRVSNGKPLNWYHLPAYRARYDQIKADPSTAPEHVNVQVLALMWMLMAVFACLTILGWYVTIFIIP